MVMNIVMKVYKGYIARVHVYKGYITYLERLNARVVVADRLATRHDAPLHRV